jgi:hypothetical protein
MSDQREKEFWMYEMRSKTGHYNGDALLTFEEEKIMKTLRSLEKLWKNYKSKPLGNRLILFCGGTGCDIRFERPSTDKIIESYPSITCDGGDGGDTF